MASSGTQLTPARAVFALVSFEGPDRYSQAGGLSVRAAGLAQTLAELGYETHLFFIGDPRLPGQEVQVNGRLHLHRWSQWVSRYHRGGVYDGEEDKRLELNRSLPSYLAGEILAPAARTGRIPIVLSEEWQTAECASLISDTLHQMGVRDRSILFWNANNTYSFSRIDWQRLSFTNTLTTVSRYMRSIMRSHGVDALVIPNGIPSRLLRPVDRDHVMRLRDRWGKRQIFFKMARWQPEKGWDQALDAVVRLRERGHQVTLVARSGGPTGSGGGLGHEATARGLSVRELGNPGGLHAQLDTIADNSAEVVNLRFGVSEELARILFAGADGVLANSVYEPFGLVGLEAMAASGVAYTGGTGEDYAVPDHNAVVLETLDPTEIADRAEELASDPERVNNLREAAHDTARLFTWDAVVRKLLSHIDRRARARNLI